MLVISVADDDLVPMADTLAFKGHTNTEAHLLPDTGHCAVSTLTEVLDTSVHWLPRQLDIEVPPAKPREVDAAPGDAVADRVRGLGWFLC
jgi:hypothetical protein